MTPTVNSLDHLVLTVTHLGATVRFYETALGMVAEKFTPADGTRRVALKFGAQKINLHQAGAEFEPKAEVAMPGSADLCFLSDVRLAGWIRHLEAQDVPIELGPVPRTGATGALISIYVRDPDANLIEISNRV